MKHSQFEPPRGSSTQVCWPPVAFSQTTLFWIPCSTDSKNHVCWIICQRGYPPNGSWSSLCWQTGRYSLVEPIASAKAFRVYDGPLTEKPICQRTLYVLNGPRKEKRKNKENKEGKINCKIDQSCDYGWNQWIMLQHDGQHVYYVQQHIQHCKLVRPGRHHSMK